MQDYNYNESKQRGTIEFPIDYHYVDEQHPQYEMAYHWHIEHEFIRILSGEFHLFLDGQVYHAIAGDVYYIQDGILHGGSPIDCVYECIVFDINMLRNRPYKADEFIRKIAHNKVSLDCKINVEVPSLSFACNLLFETIRTGTHGCELLINSILLLIFGAMEVNHFYSSDVDETVSTRQHKRTEQLKLALELIESSYASTLSLDELSKAAGMSPKYFCRFFQEMTHRTPIDYVNFYRIERACYLISTSDQSLTEIAYQCGFNDFSYFIKLFKKYKGTTPKRYLSL